MKQDKVDFVIESIPIAIAFDCPHCGEYAEVAWDKVDSPNCWSDDWPDAKCPRCGKAVALGEWNYD